MSLDLAAFNALPGVPRVVLAEIADLPDVGVDALTTDTLPVKGATQLIDSKVAQDANGVQAAGDLSVVNAIEAAGGLNFRSAREVHTLALSTTSTTTLAIPANSLILGVVMNVDTVVVDDAGDDTWTAAWDADAGSTAIVAAASPTLDTKVNQAFVPILTTGAADIVFTPNAGSFSAGVIRVVVFYIDMSDLADV